MADKRADNREETMKKLTVLAAAALFATLLPASVKTAQAAKFPDKPVQLVITSSAGSGISNWGLMIGEILSRPGFLGVPVHVLFKGGGSGNESAAYVYNKPADGYTLLQFSGSHAGYFNLPTMRYPYKDFEFLARIQRTIYAVGVPGDSQFKTLKDVVAYAKAHPGKLVMGSNKVGSIHERMQIALWKAFHVDVRFVPYKGTGRVVKDVVGHHLPIGMGQPGLWLPHIKAGTARMLLVLNDKRLPDFPNVPVPSDFGLHLNLPVQFQALAVKKGTPAARIAVLRKALHKAVETKTYKTYIKNAHNGQLPYWSTDTKAFNAYFKNDIARARKFMIENHIIKK